MNPYGFTGVCAFHYKLGNGTGGESIYGEKFNDEVSQLNIAHLHAMYRV
jgi:hypothetical protein